MFFRGLKLSICFSLIFGALSALGVVSPVSLGAPLGASNEKFQLYKANTFRHNYPRVIISSQNYPWRAFGKITDSVGIHNGCSAGLIGKKWIITNRHCLEDKNEEVELRQYQFVPNLMGDIYNSESIGAYPISWGGDKQRRNDWVILELDYPKGLENGYLGIKSEGRSFKGNPGSLLNSPNPEWETNLCKNTSNPIPLLAGEREVQMQNNWKIDHRNPMLPKVCMGGYPGDLGGEEFVLSQQCSIVGEQYGFWTHDCPSSKGSSGSPIFYRSNTDDYYIVALNAGEYRGGKEAKSRKNVIFGAFNANSAVNTEGFISYGMYLNSQTDGKAYFYFRDTQNVGKGINNYINGNDAIFEDRQSNLSKCAKDVLESLGSNGTFSDTEFTWNTKISDLVKSKTSWDHPSKSKKTSPGFLVVFEDESGDVKASILSPYGITYKDTKTLVTSSDFGSCRVTEELIIEYLESL